MKTVLVFLVLSVAFGLAETPTKAAATQPRPEKVLLLSLTIPAPRSEVWHAFSTSDGLSTWLTPNAVVDLRSGGEWTAHYPGGKTGGGTIISFIPEEEIVISAMAPEQFPTVRATRTKARFRFKASDDHTTTVELEQTGWQDGAEWDKAYEYLFAGNAYLLATLHRRFVNGPIDWDKEWAGAK